MSILSSLVFSCTYKCPIKCKFCGAECGPEQTDRLSLSEMTELIDTVYSYGKLELVVFTGGEPFLLGRDLKAAVQYCSDKGVSTRIVTNAYWARDLDKALRSIRSLKEAGLTEINLSCDDYHQEFIPLERIKHANEACIELDIPCLIGHKVMKDHTLTLEYLEKFLGHKLTIFDPSKPNPKNNLVSTGYTVPVAENMHKIPDEEILYPPSCDSWKSPCKTILQRIVVTPRKELSICCGMIRRNVEEVIFGNLEESSIEELILKAHNDLIVNWLALEGPYGIMRFILEKRPDIKFREQYVNICHLCSEILTRRECRSVLATYAHEKAAEIAMEKGLYDFMRKKEFRDSA